MVKIFANVRMDVGKPVIPLGMMTKENHRSIQFMEKVIRK